jgi:hypothetical protein
MIDRMHKSLAGLKRLSAASDELLAESENTLHKKLPADYVQFLKFANGGEGYVGSGVYLVLWSAQDLSRLNELYEVQENAPGLVIFGSDGGGEAFGFDTRTIPWTIVQVPFVGMSWEQADPLAHGFSEFIDRLSTK